MIQKKEAKKSLKNEVDHNYKDLAEMKKSRFLTTNYDEFLDDYIKGEVIYLTDLELMEVNHLSRDSNNNLIIAMHGDISHPDKIVLSRKSYEDLYDTKRFEKEFQFLRQSFTFLFMGFSFDDAYFKKQFKKLASRLNV